ncbi:MAG: helix-turn-helix domain-containing protein [Paracoccus sp. (in: a-proteobacteria)]
MAKTTRDAIIVEARAMFRDLGYAGFSMGELARRVGVQKASLYTRFSGKDELARAALSLTLSELTAIAAPGPTLCMRYRALLEGIADYLGGAKRCIGLHLLYDGAGDDGILTANRAFFDELLALCRAVLATGLAAEVAEKLAEDSLGALEGATMWLILNDDPAPMQRAIDSLLITVAALVADAGDGAGDIGAGDAAGDMGDAARIMSRYPAEIRSGSEAERKLVAEVARLEGELLTARAALAGQIAAESCFL